MTEVSVQVQEGIRLITFQRPKKKNAITSEIYDTLTKSIGEADKDPNTRITVITGSGDCFCAGQDLAEYSRLGDDFTVGDMLKFYRNFVRSLIDSEKPIVAIVNGKAVGIGVTMLGLCDAVFASDEATFRTPFVSLALAPEGCSSLIFPRSMGYPQAGNILMFNEEINAVQAMVAGLVTQVFPKEELENRAWEKIRKWVKLPPEAMKKAKKIMRERDRQLFHTVNDNEYELVKAQTETQECADAVIQFFTGRSKL